MRRILTAAIDLIWNLTTLAAAFVLGWFTKGFF